MARKFITHINWRYKDKILKSWECKYMILWENSKGVLLYNQFVAASNKKISFTVLL